MKILLLQLGLFVCISVCAQESPDSVVMMVADKQVPLSEFVFIAKKNGEVNLSDAKSLRDYVELFKNFKLKVAEAELRGIDKTPQFKVELDGYCDQLLESYLPGKGSISPIERKSLEEKYPEIPHLMQEYRDGILLFEVSNQEIWNKPVNQQEDIERQWVKELSKKFPVVINWTLIKRLEK